MQTRSKRQYPCENEEPTTSKKEKPSPQDEKESVPEHESTDEKTETLTKTDTQLDIVGLLPPEIGVHVLSFLDADTVSSTVDVMWPRLGKLFKVLCVKLCSDVPVYYQSNDVVYEPFLLRTHQLDQSAEGKTHDEFGRNLCLNYVRVYCALKRVQEILQAFHWKYKKIMTDRYYTELEDHLRCLGYFDLDPEVHGKRDIRAEENIIECFRFVCCTTDPCPYYQTPIERIPGECLISQDAVYMNYQTGSSSHIPNTEQREPLIMNIFNKKVWYRLKYRRWHPKIDRSEKRNGGVGFQKPYLPWMERSINQRRDIEPRNNER